MKVFEVMSKPLSPRWFKSSFSSEREEFERVAEDQGVSIDDLEQAYTQAKVVDLDNYEWRNLLNTDSNEERWAYGDEDSADNFLKNNYDKQNLKPLLDTIKRGGQIPAPIVYDNGMYRELVAGNTRLMACSILGIQPKVVVVTVPKYDKR